MPRPRNVIRTSEIHIMLPVDLVAQIQMRLFSHALGRIPLGAQARFFERAARDLLARIEAGHTQLEQS